MAAGICQAASAQDHWAPTQRIFCGQGTKASPGTYTMATIVQPGVAVTEPLSRMGLVILREPYTDYNCQVPRKALDQWKQVSEPVIVWPKVGETVITPVKDPKERVTMMVSAKIAGIKDQEFTLTDQKPRPFSCGEAAFSTENGTPALVGFYDCTKKALVSAQRFAHK